MALKEVENSNITFSGSTIAKNTIYNLLGYGIPLIFALILIPLLLKGLGTEKFGILSLAWVVIGYFSFFDFGIGRAITQMIAEKIGTNQIKEIPGLFWTSFFMMLFLSLFGSLLLLFLAPTLVYNSFKISKVLQSDTLAAFYILIISIPIVTTTAGIRGVLEAYQKFGILNIIRTFLGISSFLGPLLCLIFTQSLFLIVLFLVLVRIVVWVLYMTQCLKLNSELKSVLSFKLNLIKPIIKLSGWMTVSNVIGPIIVYLDRFFIGSMISASAISYYSTPYEIISKILLIPGAVTGVLFPAVSASYIKDPAFARKRSLNAIKYIFILLYPIVFLIIVFAHDAMALWLGKEFAEKSSLILQLMAAGALFNSLAYIPVTFFQGIGRADITAKIHLIELPIYMVAMWISINNNGINGAAVVWLIRMVADALIFILLAKKQMSVHLRFKFSHILLLFLTFASIYTIYFGDTKFKVISAITIVLAFILISWRYFLSQEDRFFLISRLKILRT